LNALTWRRFLEARGSAKVAFENKPQAGRAPYVPPDFLRQIISDRQNLRYTSGFAERMPECPRQPQSQSIS
jgi:hypothetical protein